MTIRTIFQTSPSKNLISIGLLVVRLGLGAGFLWAGINKVSDPAAFGMMLQNMAGIDPMMAPNMALLIGGLEILSGVLIWIGLITRIAVGYQLVVLIGAQVMFGFDFTMGPAIWKDPALIGITILLLLSGSGKFGLDYLISKRSSQQYNDVKNRI